MSANLDLVRSIYADWERGDFGRADWADADMAFVFADGPEPTSGRGAPAMWTFWRDVLSAWQDHRAVAQEHRELDDGRILTLTLFSAKGRASGIDLTHVLAKGASLMELHNGRVTKVVLYFDRDLALASLGLEE
jgi:hypothetical protein